MPWLGLEGHDAVVERFRRALERGRLAGTYLFVGPAGIGKRSFALRLAQTLLCGVRPEAAMNPCGACPACQQVVAQTHPDLLLVSKPPDKATIPLELLIGPPEKRTREGLCHSLALASFMGGRKVAIIDDADDLNIEGANSLLKTLEEPPPRTTIILIGTSLEKQLPTIRSRSQVISFRPLAPAVLERLVLEQNLAAEPEAAAHLARHCEGSLARAAELADAELWKFRGELLRRLADRPLPALTIARAVNEFVEAAGKEAAAKRVRARTVIGFAAEFYRAMLRIGAGAMVGDDRDLAAVVAAAAKDTSLDVDRASEQLDRTLEALEHVDRNAHLVTVIECWLDDLARIASARRVAV
ncbi:MAG: DNA polymerase III subunit [Pirellulales bacterium]|nr:DNA polymerase III subunit [Pirellulales bacterium]